MMMMTMRAVAFECNLLVRYHSPCSHGDVTDVGSKERRYASIVIEVHVSALGMCELVFKPDNILLKHGMEVCIVYLRERGAPSPMPQNYVATSLDEVDDSV